MARPTPDYRTAMAAGRDAGNRAMRAAGRTAWSDDDWATAQAARAAAGRGGGVMATRPYTIRAARFVQRGRTDFTTTRRGTGNRTREIDRMPLQAAQDRAVWRDAMLAGAIIFAAIVAAVVVL